ncbi:MAG TPA: nucleoside-diphosphate sugar epimerase [Gammaproteobacteria bacterium]|nr:nucleoside-diphosphate sugar epimerase [Gammaproteobacteria bacterium]
MPLLRRRLHPQKLRSYATPARVVPVSPRQVQPCPDRARVVWRFSDGKAGHDSQSLGLVDALKRRGPVDAYDIPVRSGAGMDWLLGRFPAGSLLPDPWLMIGAGHSTHLPLLSARRVRGGKAVVLMRPDLPKSLFDLCIIPEHDRPEPAANILVTCGSLNRMQPVYMTGSNRGLLMIGGPSRHYHWDHRQVVEQIARVIRYSPVRDWILTTSRRTPPGFAEYIRQMIFNRNLKLTVLSCRDTTDQWLALQLSRSCCTWVTEDSVSMIYEALTAGVPVGLLSVPPRRRDRIVNGVQALVASRNVMRFSDWSAGRPLPRPRQVFDEANRIAGEICGQWGSKSNNP